MKLTLEINGITRVFQGSYDEMRNRNWNVRVADLLDAADEYEEGCNVEGCKNRDLTNTGGGIMLCSMHLQAIEDAEETLCGKPHNNGEEDNCMECGVIKLGI